LGEPKQEKGKVGAQNEKENNNRKEKKA